MNFGLDFGSIGIVKTLCLTYRNVFMIYVGKLVGMCKLFFFFLIFFNFYDHGKILWVCAWIYLWVLANFVGIVEKFCWVCENLFVHEVVGIFSWHAEIFFLHGYGKIW